ncbi:MULTISPECIES: putative holin-like toxin [Paenibacillus]|nr:putative holin-like toxin [Paenibacillus odorifer]
MFGMFIIALLTYMNKK